MTIWLLALILLASLAGLGYRQGAVRVGFSFFGIIVGALVAVPLGRFAGKALGPFGLKDPVLVWALGPLIVFIIISIIFKVAAAAVHHKVDVHFKYHAGDLRLALWERLNARVGLCLGLLNGTAYLILISFALYFPGYVAYGVATPDQDPKWLRLLSRLGQDLQSTRMDKVARALDSIPQSTYDMVDFGATLYRTPLALARLSSYPAFLGLAELPEFQALAADSSFTKSWQQQEPILTLLDNGSALAIRNNPDLLKVIWNTVLPDLADVRGYLKTAQSASYDPIRILGRWTFSVNAAASALRRAKPTMPASEMLKWRKFFEATFSKTRLTAKPDKQFTLKDAPPLKLPSAATMSAGTQTVQGQWDGAEGKYLLSYSGLNQAALVEGDRLTIKGEGMDFVFERED
jgi:hypothetical protein